MTQSEQACVVFLRIIDTLNSMELGDTVAHVQSLLSTIKASHNAIVDMEKQRLQVFNPNLEKKSRNKSGTLPR